MRLALAATVLAAFTLCVAGAQASPEKDPPVAAGPAVALVPESGPAEGSTVATHVFNTTFEFKSVETGEFECSLDGAAFELCRSPFEVQDGPGGRRTFSVRGVGREGAPGPAETRTWNVVYVPIPTPTPYPGWD